MDEVLKILSGFIIPDVAAIAYKYLGCISRVERLDYYSHIGYKITDSSDKTMEVRLSNCPLYSETYGIFLLSTSGKVQKFKELVGQEILSITFGIKLICDFGSITDVGISEQCYKELPHYQKVFVNIRTCANTYQIFAYNYHNGSYSHGIRFRWQGVDEIQEI